MEEVRLYRIGQLSRLANLSRRTIDYYTRLGLIQPEKRSDSNYRYYSDETLQRLQRITKLKQEKYSLDEIKENLEQWDKVSHLEHVAERLTTLQLHIQQLEKEVNELRPAMERLKPAQAKSLSQMITPRSAALIEALLLLCGKGPLL